MILGQQDSHLQLVEAALAIQIVARGTQLHLSGSPAAVEKAERVFAHLQVLAQAGVQISPVTVNYALATAHQEETDDAALLTQTVYTTPKGKAIKPKSFGQWQYLQAMDRFDLVFGIGPAGTGKTYLAVLKAVEALRQKRVSKLVLARPAVEAGEKLGFLPGDLQEKVNPYLRPVYDALNEVLGADYVNRYLERGVIEVVPLAYMRGRTLHDAFIILDEAQNTTPPQMKMFLTRLGTGSRAVVTGDITQIDLPQGAQSGLVEAERRLHDIPGISFCYLARVDVVRHPLVQKIIEAYERKWL